MFNNGKKIARLIQPGNPALEQIIQNGITPRTTILPMMSISKKPGKKKAANILRSPVLD
tara:strand:- start:92041 stop:92217 length:177 start_codon:yes stop_codon:yes gene_type:complete